MDESESSSSRLQSKMAESLRRRGRESKLRNLKASPPGSIDFSSNDFLSLSTSIHLRELFMQELETHSSQLGSTGSRLLDGNSTYSESLEQEIATFHSAPVGLLANSGFDASVGIFSCLPQPGDLIVHDELIHASVHDGMRVSRAGRTVSFAHNCVSDLQKKLERSREDDAKLRNGQRSVIIAVESVYSMEGDLAPLVEIADVVERLFPKRNAHIVVDEAHATGIYGSNGRGRVSELGLEDRIFVRLHTFGKSLASNGAIILCSPLTRLYLLNYARSLIYTTFMSHPSLAAIKAGYRFMASGATEPVGVKLFEELSLGANFNLCQLARQLWDLVQTMYSRLRELSRKHAGRSRNQLSVPAECPKSPIFALMTPNPRSLAQHCQNACFIVRAVVPPTVPSGAERVRVCLHAGNTVEQIESFVDTVQNWVLKSLQDPPLVDPLARQAKL